jgi:GT2 family glycosyltransferase
VAESDTYFDLSICIVNWNCCDYLRALLTSIESERDKLSIEVIVVDNASTDNSAAVVRAEFPAVCLIRNDLHKGVAAANNQAAAQAHGKLLLFLNNDTRIQPGALTTLVDFIENQAEVSAVAPSLISPDGTPQENVRKLLGFQVLLHRVLFLRWTGLFRAANRHYRQVDFDLKRSAYVEHLVGPALLVRRRQFDLIGGWDEAFEFGVDDIDLSLRLGQLGKMYYLADAQVIHWGGVAKELDEPYSYRCSECSYIHYLRKHHAPWKAQIYKLLIIADMPVRISILALTWLIKKSFGTRERAARNYRKLAAATQFLVNGLPHYWQS